MKHLISILLLACASVTVSAQAEQTRYVSDNLFTYMHKGPSTQYKIIGSVNAGTKVTLLNTNKETGFSQIVDSRGRTGWINTKFVSNQTALKERVPALEKELSEVKAELSTAKESSSSQTSALENKLQMRNDQITDLESRNQKLNEQLVSAQEETRDLRARLDTRKDDLLMRWFMYGGGIAGAGLLFGLILPSIIPRRKKRNNGWA